MKRAHPPYVYAKHVKGKTYYRFERGGVSQQVNPDAPDFWQVYAKLRAENPAPSVPTNRTFSALAEHYYGSTKFKKLKPRTQADYRGVIGRILKAMGDKNPTQVKRHHVVRWQEELSGRAASYFVQVMSVLMEHARDIGWRESNPCQGVTKKQTEAKSPHIPWPIDVIAKWRENARSVPLLIFELGIGSAQRPGDWVTFNWEDYDGDMLHVRQGKTDKELKIPASRHMKAALSKRPKVMRLDGKTPIISARGKRMSYRRMAEIMLAERKRLKTEAYDLHGLRYTSIQEFARADCTDDEIMSYSGHNTKAMVEKYAGEVRQEAAAKRARKKRDGA